MQFVDLKRNFIPVKNDVEPDVSIGIGRAWGLKYGGWLDWTKLLDHPRVVLLAEAASGKTEEFQHAAKGLRAKGSAAFYATIENLADRNFLPDPADQALFDRWKSSEGTAWFFMDSIDEARLNRKRFDDALRHLAARLGPTTVRARILVSCRVSDWKASSDRATIVNILPVGKPEPVPVPPADPDTALLDPIFAREDRSQTDDNEDAPAPPDVLVVQLVPLSDEQRRSLAQASGLTNVDAFLAAIEKQGLDVLAERPGDLLELAQYWSEHRSFGSLVQMTETSVAAKLKEPDPYRADNDSLTAQKARQGAERLAGALTLAKTFTLVAPGGEVDPSLAVGALDPAQLLDDWTIAESNALLRRGVFAPSTYGRVRFHHRSTQEYLAARWLKRLLEAGCERSEVADLLFVESYGVKTVAPSLRATAAWLALDRPEFRKEIIDREPLLLLTHGDPGALPTETKAELLLHLARRHANGDIADDSVDRRSMWMFATPALSDAIHQAWVINTRSDFRTDLMRLVREGAITGCVDLAITMASDATARDYSRIVALEALVACEGTKELGAILKAAMRHPEKLSPRVAAGFAKALFPKHLSLAQLLTLVAKSAPVGEDTIEGFAYSIDDLWRVCPVRDRPAFVDGVAALCASEPFINTYQRVSKRHALLAKHLGGIAHSALAALGSSAPNTGLIRLLAVVERAERGSHSLDMEPPLNALVRSNPAVQRALFWHDVEEARAHRGNKTEVIVDHWSIFFGGSPLWALSEADLPWLEDDLARRPLEDDRRVALSAVRAIFGKSVKGKAGKLRKLVVGNAALAADLARYLAPAPPSAALRRSQAENAASKRKRERRIERDKASWIGFRADLSADPSRLADPAGVLMAPAFGWLRNLTHWLTRKTGKEHIAAALEWRLLEPAFGHVIAEHYREGMKALWRAGEPTRPHRPEGGPVTVKWGTILSFAGLALENAENPEFVRQLSVAEARRAALHGCVSEQGYPVWIERLADAFPTIVVPIVRDEFDGEWKSIGGGPSYLLYRFAQDAAALNADLQAALYDVVTGSEPSSLNILDYGLVITRKLPLSEAQRLAIRQMAQKRFEIHAKAGKAEWAARYLALLFHLDTAEAFRTLSEWLRKQNKSKQAELSEFVLAVLFGHDDPLAGQALAGARVSILEPLLHVAFQMIKPERDNVHEGSYSPDRRDNAENARNAILKALIETRGAEAFEAMIRLSNRRDMRGRRIRFRELARRMAERDADPVPWSPDEVRLFERQHMLPVKTGSQLYRAARKIVAEIGWDFDHEDASSRAVLETAADEDAVQNYLAEQLRLRAKGRYHTARESEVAEGNMPDIVLSATQGMAEVAIEAKHGGKKWSTATLVAALRGQLANDYLRPSQRRHGLLVITNHKKRGWNHPVSGKNLSFPEMVAYLNTASDTITRNAVGDIVVSVIGIDALPKPRTRSEEKDKRAATSQRRKTKPARKR